jgi:hypothetical protein
MPAGHSFSLVGRLTSTGRGVEYLESSFEWAILRPPPAKSALPARLDDGGKRELCEDVPFFPLLEGLAQVPFAGVLSQMQRAMLATGDPLSPIDGMPLRSKGHFLQAIGGCLLCLSPGAASTGKERFACTAALNEPYGTCSWQIADGAG